MTVSRPAKDRKVVVKHSNCVMRPTHIRKPHVKNLFANNGHSHRGWTYEERCYMKRRVDSQGNIVISLKTDKYFYPPMNPAREIRSEVNLHRYLLLLQQSGGDYAEAYRRLKLEKPRP